MASQTIDLCEFVNNLVVQGRTFAGLPSGVPLQAAKVYILALTLKELGGADYSTDLCSLLDQLKGCASLPDYDLQRAYLAALAQNLSRGSVEEFQSALAGCCCEANMSQLKVAEAFLLFAISNQQPAT